MPGNFLTADTKFPKLDDTKSDKENLTTVVNYLYMLLEQLRYTLGNLGTENFNDNELEEFVNIITEPVYIQLQDDKENISNLMVQAESFSTRLQDAEDNVSTLTQTSDALVVRIQGAEGDISKLSQTVSSLTLSVSNAGTSSTISLVSNGITLSSQNITLTGYVTFSDLSTSGKTTIHGDNLITGTVKASQLLGQTVSLLNYWGSTVGTLTMTGATTSAYAVELASYAALRLTGATTAAIIGGAYQIQIGGGDTVSVRGDTHPSDNNKYTIGTSPYRWADVYAINSTIGDSDIRLKDIVSYGLDAYDKFFSLLKPVSYKFKTGHRTHLGFIAQEIEEALAKTGLSTEDFAGFIKSPLEDGDYYYGLRYGEWTALNTWKIQQLESRIKELEAKLA